MSAPTLPIAVATEPSEPGRSGKVTRSRNTSSSFPTSITAVFRVDDHGHRSRRIALGIRGQIRQF
jgi:hypothetical protein